MCTCYVYLSCWQAELEVACAGPWFPGRQTLHKLLAAVNKHSRRCNPKAVKQALATAATNKPIGPIRKPKARRNAPKPVLDTPQFHDLVRHADNPRMALLQHHPWLQAFEGTGGGRLRSRATTTITVECEYLDCVPESEDNDFEHILCRAGQVEECSDCTWEKAVVLGIMDNGQVNLCHHTGASHYVPLIEMGRLWQQQ